MKGFLGTAMMTSEDNAKRMLTKAAAFRFRVVRGRAADRYVRSVGVLVVLCTGLVACSYRTSDKTALHARTTASESVAVVAGELRTNVYREDEEISGALQASIAPFTKMMQDPAKTGVPVERATSSGIDARIEPSIQRVVGDASVFLPSSSFADEEPASKADQVHTDTPIVPTVEAVAFDQKETSLFPWAWLLAIAALIAAGGVGFSLARYRRRRVAVPREETGHADEVRAQAVRQAWQEDVQSVRSPVPEHDSSMVSEPEALTLDSDILLPMPVKVESGPIPFSLPEWSYRQPDYERREHWETTAPVDFLPASLLAQVVHETNEPSFATSVELVEETSLHDDGDSASVPTVAFSDDPLSELFEQLENIALGQPGSIPVLLIERGNTLPEVTNTTGEAVPSEMLQAWESTLRQALPDAQALTLPWLLVSTLLLRADDANNRDAEALYAEAEEWIELSMAADHERSATWRARQIDIDLRRTKRQKGAARLLSLRAMQSQYASQLAQGEPALLFAWIDVLMFWAQCQYGDAALARYAEAEAICLGLTELSDSADAAQRRRAEILRQRATIEEGGARLNSLDTAQALVNALYERVPSADHALAIAITALARGNVLPPEQAKEVYSNALIYAFMAEGEPRLRTASLQCRLAVQWAYENLPGMAVQSNVAINLAARLEALHVQHPDTLQRMAQTYLRSADFAHACALCENAWRNGRATPALLATWKDAYQQWEMTSAAPEQLAIRQQTMRQLSIASAMR
jgi:hypothetical protein